MATLDVNDGLDKIEKKLKAFKSYKKLKKQYEDVQKKAGSSLEDKKSKVTQTLSKAKDAKDAIKKKVKTQFQKLLDIAKLTGGKNTNTINYLKRAFLKTLEKVKPEIDKIMIQEMINALGCDQQQTYDPQIIYVSLKSIDLRGSLKEDPTSDIGKLFYEKLPIQYQSLPFSMNRELYQRIQSGNSFSADTGNLYVGASRQPLFDIKYVDVNPLTGVGGGWFEITLVNRVNNLNIVYQFLTDYFKSITVLDYVSLMANLMDALCGAISIEAKYGLQQVQDATKFSLLIQRVLGLCFDNATELDITGTSHIDPIGDTGKEFFVFSDLDLREIEGKVSNILAGVVEFEDCNNVKLPVNSAAIVAQLNKLFDEPDVLEAANNLTGTLAGNPSWGLDFNATLDINVNYDFLNLICDAIIRTIMAPKILLPLVTMYKAISTNANSIIIDTINSYFFFFQNFKKFMINLISKIGAIFIRELVDMIKKDILALIQSIVGDITKEKARGVSIVILKLVQLLIIGLQAVQDWRKCKSVIDDILRALSLVSASFGPKIPPQLLRLCEFLDGYSETRAFINTIEELQKIGVPTDDMPDGSPNLDVLAKFAQLKAQNDEYLENGFVEIYTDEGTWLPGGVVLGTSGFGK